MGRRIPPLNALRAFEAASRTGSFTIAASELSVSPGAISRHIAHLELVLGIRLFERGHRAVYLTHAGTKYAASIQSTFEEIETATRRLKTSIHNEPVRVRAFHNFIFRWLMPRLAPFRAAPVSSRPRIGPAQGAHSSPVATPRTNEEPKVAPPAVCERRAPTPR